MSALPVSFSTSMSAIVNHSEVLLHATRILVFYHPTLFISVLSFDMLRKEQVQLVLFVEISPSFILTIADISPFAFHRQLLPHSARHHCGAGRRPPLLLRRCESPLLCWSSSCRSSTTGNRRIASDVMKKFALSEFDERQTSVAIITLRKGSVTSHNSAKSVCSDLTVFERSFHEKIKCKPPTNDTPLER